MKTNWSLARWLVLAFGSVLLLGATVTGDTGFGVTMVVEAMDDVLELVSDRGKYSLILNHKDENTASFKATRGGDAPGLTVDFVRQGADRGSMVVDPDNGTITITNANGDVFTIEDCGNSGGGSSNLITQSFVIRVPSDEPTLLDAIQSLDGTRFAAGVSATVEIESGSYTIGQAVVINHPDGQAISINGLGSVDLNFPNSGNNGIVVRSGARLGLLDNVDLIGATSAGVGIRVEGEAYATIGSSVSVEGFGIGVMADQHSTVRIVADPTNGSVVSRNNALYGFYAQRGSVLIADDTTATNNGAWGYLSADLSLLSARRSTASGNGTSNYQALRNGVIIQ